MSHKYSYQAPLPRPSVGDPELTRPDWTAGVLRDPKLLWLDKNENTDPELAAVTSKVLRDILISEIYTYPEITPCYRKLANFLDLSPEHLIFTPGSDGAIRAVFEAYISPGDIIVHTTPTFAMYPVYSRMYGAKTITLEYQSSANGPSLSVETFIKTILEVRPKLVCLPNPDSPTGTVFLPDELRRIVEAAGQAGSLMLIDEAYHPFYEETALSWVKEYPHLVIARTFAKAWGLAGLRIGYAVASLEVTKNLHKVRPMYEVNTVAVAVVDRILDLHDEVLQSVKRLNEGRNSFVKTMRELGFTTLKTHGNFLHVSFGKQAPAIHEVLKNLVLYRLDFKEPCLKGFSRFSATTQDRFKPIIERIQEIL